MCWSLSCITSGTKERIQSIVDLNAKVCKRLIDLLGHSSSAVQHAALITVGNIVTGDDLQTQVLINLEILPRLRALLSHSKKSILKDACFTISPSLFHLVLSHRGSLVSSRPRLSLA